MWFRLQTLCCIAGTILMLPGRYWILAQPAIESPLTKLRLPDEIETRLRLRRAAEAGKTEIEFKPCQNVVDYKVRF